MTAVSDAQPSPDLPETYEQAREELMDVVRRLETGGVSLEGSLALWERGEALAGRRDVVLLALDD